MSPENDLIWSLSEKKNSKFFSKNRTDFRFSSHCARVLSELYAMRVLLFLYSLLLFDFFRNPIAWSVNECGHNFLTNCIKGSMIMRMTPPQSSNVRPWQIVVTTIKGLTKSKGTTNRGRPSLRFFAFVVTLHQIISFRAFQQKNFPYCKRQCNINVRVTTAPLQNQVENSQWTNRAL